MECHDILLEQRVHHGGEGVIFGSHGEGDLTVLEKKAFFSQCFNVQCTSSLYNLLSVF